MKRLILPILLLALVAPVAAQDGPSEGNPGPIWDGARHMVIEFLQLDEDQIDGMGCPLGRSPRRRRTASPTDRRCSDPDRGPLRQRRSRPHRTRAADDRSARSR